MRKGLLEACILSAETDTARTKHAVSFFDASARRVHVLEDALEED
jgi:hypothetical protein